jgi:hypothetical protein
MADAGEGKQRLLDAVGDGLCATRVAHGVGTEGSATQGIADISRSLTRQNAPYAQRHADAGVPIDVLRDLMDHRSVSTTQGYYRVTLRPKREAVRTLRLQIIHRTGAPAPAPSATAYELRSVAAPFGNCTEPSNVKAGGGACPIRFQCAGCGFYRADPSYLPAIEDHIQALRADRERAAAMDVDDFVLRNLTDQIEAYQHAFDTMRSKITAASDEERAEIEQAAAVLRKLRAGRTTLPIISRNAVGHDAS